MVSTRTSAAESNGLEAAFGYGWNNGWRINAAYTYNRSKYLGSGNAARDAQLASSTAPR